MRPPSPARRSTRPNGFHSEPLPVNGSTPAFTRGLWTTTLPNSGTFTSARPSPLPEVQVASTAAVLVNRPGIESPATCISMVTVLDPLGGIGPMLFQVNLLVSAASAL